MSYSYHCKLAEKDISSRMFINLVDAAVMLYEQEYGQGKSKRHTKTATKTKTPSEKEEETEEERDKRIYSLFPRKSRYSLKKRVPTNKPEQKSNGASTSSISRNPLHQLPSSSSSSSLLLLDLNTIPPDDSETEVMAAESGKKMTEVRNPRNPNPQSSLSSCLTENTSPKRRAVQDSKRSGKSKKAKVETFSWKGREAPEWLAQLMEDAKGTDLSLIFERNLFRTDVNPSESRLSMPVNELIRKDFLTPEESRIIEADINKKNKVGVGAILVNQRNEKWHLKLKRWEGNVSWSYALNSGWNDVVYANGLREGHDISIWYFRCGGVLYFALVTPPPPPSIAQSSSSYLALCL